MAKAARTPPQDLETEKILLGALMLHPNAMYEVVDLISPDAFYAPKHRTIYEAMLALSEKGEPIDFALVAAKIAERKQLDQIGGRAYLSELIAQAPSAVHAGNYAGVIQSKGVLRNLIEVADEISGLGFSEERPIDEVLDEAQSKIFKISNRVGLKSFTSLSQELHETWERIERLSHTKDGLRGVPTGFTALDNKLAGLQNSDLIILAARPSMGKTSLALDIVRRAALEHKIPVGFFALEMSAQQLTERMLAATAHVDAWRLRTGKGLSATDYENLQHAIGMLDEAPIYIDDNSTNTVLAMRSVARRLKAEKGLGLIVVDYLQLISSASSRPNDNIVQQVTEISRGLKAMARDLDVPVLALSQLSRAVEQRGGRPRLSDLRESGAIEQDADVVMFIHREDKDKRYHEAEFENGHDSFKSDTVDVDIIIAKHRNGPVGTVRLKFRDNQARFESVSEDFSDASAEAAVDIAD